MLLYICTCIYIYIYVCVCVCVLTYIPYRTYYAYFSSIEIYIVTVHTKYTLGAHYILNHIEISKNHTLVGTSICTAIPKIT